jgi:hypothetical protein
VRPIIFAFALRVRTEAFQMLSPSMKRASASLSPSIYLSIRCYCCSEKSDRTCEAELYGRPIRKGCYSLVQLSDDESLCVARAHTHSKPTWGSRRVQPFYFMILLSRSLFTEERKKMETKERERTLFIKFPLFNFSHKKSRGVMNFYTLLKHRGRNCYGESSSAAAV